MTPSEPGQVAVDDCSAECAGIHAVRNGASHEVLEPIRQGVAENFGSVDKGAATGLDIRHDHGSQSSEFALGLYPRRRMRLRQYHSSRSSRDRDRLRQEVLVGLGWHFHRIGYTDWFCDPRTQIDRLRRAIDAVSRH